MNINTTLFMIIGWIIATTGFLFNRWDLFIIGGILSIFFSLFYESINIKNRYHTEIAEDYWNREYLDYSNKPFSQNLSNVRGKE